MSTTASSEPDLADLGYIAGSEVLQQLHCFNFKRQYTWSDQYACTPLDDEFANLMHCIDALSFALMCKAEIIPYFILRDSNSRNCKRC